MARTAATLGEAAHITDYISLGAADWYICESAIAYAAFCHGVTKCRRAALGDSRTSTSMAIWEYSVCGRCGRSLREPSGEFHRRAGGSKPARPVR
jgi:hypothetical protein